MPKREDPDYVGIWEGDGKKDYGFFLLYINEKSQEKDKLMISGDIVDTLGSAAFSGFIEELYLGVHRIFFSKVYDKEKSTSTVLKQIINYDGNQERLMFKKRYVGTWTHGDDKGTFVLEDVLTVASEASPDSVAGILLKRLINEFHKSYKKNKK